MQTLLGLARLSATLLVALLCGCAAHGAPDSPGTAAPAAPAGALQQAQREAAHGADPLAAKLALWLRAQAPGGASATEIAGFLSENPDWPGRALLQRRLQQALGLEPDDAVARRLCVADPPDTVASLLRCAAAVQNPGSPAPLDPSSLPPAIAADATRAWVAGIDDPLHEAEFSRLFGEVPTPSQQWRRFDRQEWSGALPAARRQIARLAAPDRPLANARLALHRGDAGADRLAAALHGNAARDPVLLLDLARWLRRSQRDDDAAALWHGAAVAAETSVAEARQPAFWNEREALARDLLVQNRDREALFLARDRIQTAPGPRLDSDFLTGWILLRRLHAPGDAAAAFSELAGSPSLITSSRGDYWLGRALAELKEDAQARGAWTRAAMRPTTFYGQAAIRSLAPGDEQALATPIAQARDPVWTEAEAIRFAGLSFARAATMLVAWNDPHHAGWFLLRLDEAMSGDRQHALAAAFAGRLGLPDIAVAIARRAGRDGLLLAQSGWPVPYAPPAQPALPAGLALAVMRQESSFDPAIESPAGADGLMQLMPATARTLSAGKLPPGSLFQPAVNIALGTRYLSELLGTFDGTVALAVAAYNAGPNRVRQWLQQNGTPTDETAMIDWIELIPFSETRNYVQRVLESQTIYQVREETPPSARVAWGGAPP